MKKVLFSGGGTGGHIYPALSMRELLLDRLGDEIETAYSGQPDGMEARIVSQVGGLKFLPVRAQGMPREVSRKWLTFPFRNIQGIWDAIGHVRSFSPDLIVTTGGFVSFPILFAARLLGRRFVIHEQNAFMGLTNRLFAKAASAIMLTYEGAYPPEPGRVFQTGNPVRRAFFQPPKMPPMFPRKPGEFWVLCTGGSGGARSLNKACSELARDWLPRNPQVRLLHLTGERDFERVKGESSQNPNHLILPYLHEMKEAFDTADLLVSRAGATILSEIAVCGKPAILIPFPFATDNHQEKNARALESVGAARMILDRDLSGKTLAEAIGKAMNPEVLATLGKGMRSSRPPDVEERIYSCLRSLLT